MKRLFTVATILMASASTAAFAQGAGSLSTPAPDAQASEPSAAVGDIVVTARRRAERLQDVPIAVTAIGSAELQQRSVRDVRDLAAVAPSLQIEAGPRGGGFAYVNLRGLENTQGAISNDPAVGIYFDEVYVARTAGNLLSTLWDMQSVQILRGVQGTLFGRNNTGGAIVLTPNRPNLGDASAIVQLNYGNYNHLEAGAVGDISLVRDKLGIRASYYGVRQDGMGRSAVTGVDSFGDRHRDSFRVALRYEPVPDSTFDLTYDGSRINETGSILVDVPQPAGHGFYEGDSGLPSPSTVTNTDGVTFRAETRVMPEMITKLIVGYRKLYSSSVQDIDARAASTFDQRRTEKQNQWSVELQSSGTVLRNTTDWLNGVNYTAGMFYFIERGDDLSIIPWNSIPDQTASLLQYIRAENRSVAGYAQVETNHWDHLFLTLGARYTKDNRELTIHQMRNTTCTLRAFPAETPASVCYQSAQVGQGYWSYTGGARYQFSRSINVYAKLDRGQRSGGLDDSPFTIDAFLPEVAMSYEAGLKSELFDRKLRLNFAAYLNNVTNLQRLLSLAGPTGIVYSSVINAASARIKGLEVEAHFQPLPGFDLSGSFGYTDARYLQFTDRRPATAGADISYLNFPNTPKYTYSISGEYQTHLGENQTLSVRADYSHRSSVDFDLFNNPALRQAPYGLLNGRIGLSVEHLLGARTDFAIYGRNLGNVKYNNFGTSAAGLVFLRSDQPRMYGAEIRVTF